MTRAVGHDSSRRVLSLFSGMGGLDLGAELAGYRVSAAVDADQSAVDVLQRALGVCGVVGRTENLRTEDVLAAGGLRGDGSELLIGGPPCTAFSHAGFWLERKRNGGDFQAERIDDYWTYVRELRPRAFVMENVPGLAFENHRDVLASLVARARRAGYSVNVEILNAAHFGVPQARRRLFVVGVRGSGKFRFPTGGFDGCPRTAGWAFADLRQEANPPEVDERLSGRYADLLPFVPPGDNYLFFTRRRKHPNPQFGWRKRYWSFLLKLHPQEPSPTVAATRVSNNGPFHWRNRRLRVRELARLQSFPDDFPLAAIADARRHLGNAVPPVLAGQVLWALALAVGDADGARMPEALEASTNPLASAAEVSSALGLALCGAQETQSTSTLRMVAKR